jgi:hypothetical protein
MLKTRRFTVLTENKPFTITFYQKRDNFSPRQFNHLDFISQFTTNIKQISGQMNIVADIISRVMHSPH